MMNTLFHEEIGGGYTMQRKIILDASELSPCCIEVMAITDDGEELDSYTATDKSSALAKFNELIQKYAGPLQKAISSANLKPGHRYTLVYINDFGFPVSQKITYSGSRFATYAQHSDVVELVFIPFRKRSKFISTFYNCSLMIFDGWQDFDKSAIEEVIKDDGRVRVTKYKYSCFSASYIEDLENIFTNPVMIHKDYKTGINGKLYA